MPGHREKKIVTREWPISFLLGKAVTSQCSASFLIIIRHSIISVLPPEPSGFTSAVNCSDENKPLCSGLSIVGEKNSWSPHFMLSWLFESTTLGKIQWSIFKCRHQICRWKELMSSGVWTEPLQWSVVVLLAFSAHPDSQPNSTCYLGEMACLLHACLSFVKIQRLAKLLYDHLKWGPQLTKTD